MTPVALPIVVPPAGQAPALPALQPGAVLQALVLGLIDDMTMRLQWPGGMVDVKTPSPLPAGTRVQVSVEGSAAHPKLALTPLPPSAQAAPGVPSPQLAASSGLPRTIAMPPANGVTAAAPQAAQPPQAASDAAFAVKNAIPQPIQSPIQSVIETAIGALVRQAIGRQNGIAPLLADLEAVLIRPGLDIPAPVRAAASLLLAQRLDLRAPIDAHAIKSAIASSNPALADGAVRPSGPALNILRLALGNWAQAEAGIDVAPKNATPPAPSTPLALLALSASQAAAPRAATPGPPHRDAATVPQPPAMPAVPADLNARETALHLLAKTEAALARHTLLQVASLPDAIPADIAKADQAPARITLDIPLLTAQGNAAAQIRIEREQGGGREGGETRPAWSARFSIDIEPIGPVHAHVSLHGERAAVTLYAERDDSAARLREGLPLLEAGLKDAALEPGEMRCRAGAPAVPRKAPGLFVDQAS